ncbi:MAG: glycine--tRNA ligase [Lachnospiraceae bacterium]|jgi:glycyl-tRNA synthetase|nr:glycine--tRNA ligase [Lachnospiraceae bacterium]
MEKTMEKIVALAKGRGFVYPGSEIYGGLANTWDYGNLGVELKNNIKRAWWQKFIQESPYNVGVDCAILMNTQTWVASGHLGGFSDPLMDCRNCHERFRADKLIEDYLADAQGAAGPAASASAASASAGAQDVAPGPADGAVDAVRGAAGDGEDGTHGVTSAVAPMDVPIDGWTLDQMKAFIEEKRIPCPSCGKHDFTDIRQFNLMFKTFQGVTEDAKNTVYLRPETAQGIFVNFKNVQRTSRKKIPFGIGQVGKSFRNEITPGNFTFRTREFEQMELEFFCEPDTDLEWFDYWKSYCIGWLQALGVKDDEMRVRDHSPEELSFYSKATTDIEFLFPFGWGELWGIADRTDYDLTQHQNTSGEDLSYFDDEKKTRYIPYVIEPSLGADRVTLALLCSAYDEEEIGEGDVRTVLHFHPAIAPVKVGVLPLSKKLADGAWKIYEELSRYYNCEYDDRGNIGKRYRRLDEIGTPFCVTYDFESETDGAVTVRDRDSMGQERVPIGGLRAYFEEKMRF